MRVLIVKTSSLGDVIHTLPALTDAGFINTDIRFDWVVEENFSAVPAWHPLVNNVIPVAIRRWRKRIFNRTNLSEWQQFRNRLQAAAYDLIIDAQGLLKSAFITRMAKGKVRSGLDWKSAREPLASLFYKKKYLIAKDQHAIHRVRSLFAQALAYKLPETIPDYGIDRRRLMSAYAAEDYLVFLHGTTWATKHWPEQYWIELAQRANQNDLKVKLFWGNQEEKERALRIAGACQQCEVLPRLDLSGIASILAGAKAIVAVDTGLGHLAAALDVPTISLYGPTNSKLTGALGRSQMHLSSGFPCSPCLMRECKLKDYSPLKLARPLYPPCFADLAPDVVWKSLETLL